MIMHKVTWKTALEALSKHGPMTRKQILTVLGTNGSHHSVGSAMRLLKSRSEVVEVGTQETSQKGTPATIWAARHAPTIKPKGRGTGKPRKAPDEVQEARVLTALTKDGPMTRRQLQDAFGESRGGISRAISRLSRTGRIEIAETAPGRSRIPANVWRAL
jgi:predicted ArsR family transcriptional regulator